MTAKITKRFEEVALQAEEVSASEHTTHSEMFGRSTHVDENKLLGWITKAENLIVGICGENSTYYRTFSEANQVSSFESSLDRFKRLLSVFNSIKEDYESGYLTSYKSLIQAEVFGSELEQANELLESGYISAAAVIAGTVLETSLRELCDREALAHGKMDKMNADLAKKGVYNTIQQKQITALAGLRNSAAHGKSDEFNKNDVSMMIQNIENFLINHLN